MNPSVFFGAWSENIRSAARDAPESALAALFYAQKNQTLNLKGEPHEIIMTCTDVDPSDFR